MSSIKIVAGDLKRGTWRFMSLFGGATIIRANTDKNPWIGESVNLATDVESIDQLTDEKVKKLAGTAAWGVAGAVLLGPLGAIGGMLLGGNKKEVAFACKLKDGRKFMATADGRTWGKIAAATFT
jgi:hypothetical protein